MKDFNLFYSRLSQIKNISSGLSQNLIYGLKGIIIIAVILLIINFIDAYKKKKVFKKYVVSSLFLILFSISLYLFVFSRLVSKEEYALYLKNKKTTIVRAEEVIDELERYRKSAEFYPSTLIELKNRKPSLKIKDAFGKNFVYFSDKHTFRISFKLPFDKGYYFYNSFNTSREKMRGYYFKYMRENPVE
jgi:hypothetical protein